MKKPVRISSNPRKSKKEPAAASVPNTITLNPAAVARLLGGISLLLVLVSLTGQYLRYCTVYENAWGLIPLVDVDRELTIPTVFSSLLLFIASILLMVITALIKKKRGKYVWNWALLAFGFLFMSFDEGSSIHELTVMPIRRALGENLPGAFFFAWLIPGIIVVIILAIIFLKFLLNLPKRTKILFVAAAVLYLTGAVVLEMIGGNYASIYGIKNLEYNLIVTVEESLELAGQVIFIYALLEHIREHFGEVCFQ